MKANRLVSRMISTASNHVGLAYQAQASRENSQFYLHAGVSIELLLKARLAAEHPVLIADSRNFSSMLELVRATSHDEMPSHTIRTITVTEAMERCRQVIPEISSLVDAVKSVLTMRNGAAHMGMATSKNVTGDLRAVSSLVDYLVQNLDQDRERFYGDFLNAVDAQLDESRADAERSAATAIAAARRRFFDRFSGMLPSPNLEEAINFSGWEDRYETQRHRCPACGSEALLHGESYPEWTDKLDDDGRIETTELRVEFYSMGVECRLCGLELRGAELRGLDIPDSFSLSDFDPDDFLNEEQL